jgi:hypothetical protein
MDSSKSDEPGLTRTELEIVETIFHDGPLAIQADYARKCATEVAALASRGLLSSLDTQGNPTRQWRLTALGQFALDQETF